jgi:nucleoside-diphosphate-sugar epimerase
MPSGRFWAKNNPEKDYEENVEKTVRFLKEWKYKKFVQISTVSARCQLDTVYGRHKAAAEKLCNFADNLIVRLGALYGGNMTKGVLVDMLQGKKVFVDGASRYSFVSVDVATEWIAKNLHRSGIVEFGGKNAIALQDVAKHLQKDMEFEGELDHQDIESPDDDFPEASDVLAFLDSQKI